MAQRILTCFSLKKLKEMVLLVQKIEFQPYDGLRKPKILNSDEKGVFELKYIENSLFKTAHRLLILPDCNPTFSRAFKRYIIRWNRTPGTLKKNSQPIFYIFILYTYDGSTACTEKHGFLKFWSLDLENGLGWTSWTSWNGPGTKFLAFLTPS